jgi:hypothetical protein
MMTAVSDRDRNLLRQIEQAILDDSTTTTSILQKCNHPRWARRLDRAARVGGQGAARLELDDELPSYRTVNAIMRIDGHAGHYLIKGQIIGPEDLPEVVRETASYNNTLQFRQGLGELEAHARRDNDTVRFTRETGSKIVTMMNYERRGSPRMVHSLYWEVSRHAVEGIVAQVRTSLAELVGELLATLPPDADTPSKQAADQAVQYIVSGKRNTVNVTTAQPRRRRAEALAPPRRPRTRGRRTGGGPGGVSAAY